MSSLDEIRSMLAPWRTSMHRDEADTLRAFMDLARDHARVSLAVARWIDAHCPSDVADELHAVASLVAPGVEDDPSPWACQRAGPSRGDRS